MEGTHKSDEPVSKMTLNCCGGVPMLMLPTYAICRGQGGVVRAELTALVTLVSQHATNLEIVPCQQSPLPMAPPHSLCSDQHSLEQLSSVPPKAQPEHSFSFLRPNTKHVLSTAHSWPFYVTFIYSLPVSQAGLCVLEDELRPFLK